MLPGDLDAAWRIGELFPDQDFPIVERTSFAVMERLGVTSVASFEDHFASPRPERRIFLPALWARLEQTEAEARRKTRAA